MSSILRKAQIVTLTFLLSCSLFSQKLQIKNLQCEYAAKPLGVESLQPKLSWQIISTQRTVVQTAYRIVVADNQASIKKNIGNVWDTKRTASNRSIQVLYAGPTLQSVKTYYWKVMVWDNHNNTSSWSNETSWQMGLLTKVDWKNAQWIAYEKMPDSMLLSPLTSEAKRKDITDVLPLLRKEFSIKKPLKKATVFIAGLGHFVLSLNSKKAGDHFLDPGWTNYDKQSLYVTFDVTSQLKQGGNAIGVMLGNGFYFIPGQRYRKLQTAYGYPKMICRMVLEYNDGTTADILSDESWKTAPGPTTFSSIFGGEDFNATLEQPGWDGPSFNDRSWKTVVSLDGPPELHSQTAAPIKIFQNFTPARITQIRAGVWLYDFGQNASGIPHLAVKGKKAAVVRLWPAELLNKNGSITTEPIGSPVYFDYTLKGEGVEIWQPQFTYYGFRYVQVEGAVPEGEQNPDNLPVVTAMKSLHTRNAAPTVGTFSCSNELFNKTNKLVDWSVRSNMSSVFTDCPHREKLGWLEVAHLMGPSIRYNYDIAGLCRKVIKDMIAAQTADGLVPDIAPEFAVFGGPFRDSPEWGSNSIIMPWYMYEWYGDKQMLEEAYPMMERYISYLQSKSKENILSHGLGDWYDIGPKPLGPSQRTPRGITATAIYYYDLSLMSKVAALIGKQEEANKYAQLAAKVKASYNSSFFNKNTKQYATGSQTSNAISVYMDLVEPEYKDSVVDNIVKELHSRNDSLTAGDVGYRYLLRALEDNGRSDVIYNMNSNAGRPGYGYQISRGATALTESWQGNDNASNNHMMLGHIMEWFYSGLAGIKPAKNTVAFKEIVINPQPVGDITAAQGSYDSPYGTISGKWKKDADRFELIVEIPVNSTAVIYLPAKETARITEGGKVITGMKDLKFLRFENGKALIQVGSGKYIFNVN